MGACRGMTILHLLPGSSGFEEALPNSQPNWLCLSSCCPSIPAPVSHTQTSLVYFFNKKVFSHGPPVDLSGIDGLWEPAEVKAGTQDTHHRCV